MLSVSATLDLSRASQKAAAPVNLSGLTREGLRQALIDADICPPEKARMRASQIWGWIHNHGVTDFDAMSNVARDTREQLAAAFTLARPEIVERQVSNDGTRKWLIRTAPGIETQRVCGKSGRVSRGEDGSRGGCRAANDVPGPKASL